MQIYNIFFVFSQKKCQCVTKPCKRLIINDLHCDTSQKDPEKCHKVSQKCHRSVTEISPTIKAGWKPALPVAYATKPHLIPESTKKRSPKSLDLEDPL